MNQSFPGVSKFPLCYSLSIATSQFLIQVVHVSTETLVSFCSEYESLTDFSHDCKTVEFPWPMYKYPPIIPLRIQFNEAPLRGPGVFGVHTFGVFVDAQVSRHWVCLG